MEGAVEALDEQRFHDGGELHGHAVGIGILLPKNMVMEILDRPVAIVGQAVGPGQHFERVIVSGFHVGVEHVKLLQRPSGNGETDALRLQILPVGFLVVQVRARAPHGNRREDFLADELRDGHDGFARLGGGHVARFVPLLHPGGEKALEVRDFEGCLLAVLEQQQEVVQVAWRIVEWRGGDEDDFLGFQAVGGVVAHLGLAEFLEAIIHVRGGVAELVGFIHDDYVVALGMLDLVEAAAGNEVHVGEVEAVQGLLPGVLHGGRHDDERAADMNGIAVREKEFLGDLAGDDGLAQANDIRQEKAIVLAEQVVALVDGVGLVGQAHKPLRQIVGG